MPVSGCMNPNAVNYNPSATMEDNSCIYLVSHAGTCRKFTDYIDPSIDKSFTLSYSVLGKSWVFFHDYLPDMYIHTRDTFYPVKNSTIYKAHEGLPGTYFNGTNSFFIDIVFRAESDLLLESISWVTEFLSTTGRDAQFDTLSHISIWNSSQHSGRIALSQVFDDLAYEARRTKGVWSFNDFRDILKANGEQFLLDVFHNYALDVNQVSSNVSWYDRALLQDKWFCIRFEFDNSSGKKVILHDTTITALKSNR